MDRDQGRPLSRKPVDGSLPSVDRAIVQDPEDPIGRCEGLDPHDPVHEDIEGLDGVPVDHIPEELGPVDVPGGLVGAGPVAGVLVLHSHRPARSRRPGGMAPAPETDCFLVEPAPDLDPADLGHQAGGQHVPAQHLPAEPGEGKADFVGELAGERLDLIDQLRGKKAEGRPPREPSLSPARRSWKKRFRHLLTTGRGVSDSSTISLFSRPPRRRAGSSWSGRRPDTVTYTVGLGTRGLRDPRRSARRHMG